MPFETQKNVGRWGKLYPIYIYMFMASNIAMSCITCVTLNWIGCLVILLMEEIWHQLKSSSSHYLQGFYTSQVVVWDFHQQIFRSIVNYTSAAINSRRDCTWEITLLVSFLSKRYMNQIWMETDSKISEIYSWPVKRTLGVSCLRFDISVFFYGNIFFAHHQSLCVWWLRYLDPNQFLQLKREGFSEDQKLFWATKADWDSWIWWWWKRHGHMSRFFPNFLDS